MNQKAIERLRKLAALATKSSWRVEPNLRLEKGCLCLSCWEPDELLETLIEILEQETPVSAKLAEQILATDLYFWEEQ